MALPSVSFEKDSDFVDEEGENVEVCFFITTGHTEPINVLITPVEKGVDSPAASNDIFS